MNNPHDPQGLAARAGGYDPSQNKNRFGGKPNPGEFWKPETCKVCRTLFKFVYTDDYAVARCVNCGAPYRAFDKVPLNVAGIEKVYVWTPIFQSANMVRQFLAENPGRRSFAGVFDKNLILEDGIPIGEIGIPRTKSGDSWEDIVAWRKWIVEKAKGTAV